MSQIPRLRLKRIDSLTDAIEALELCEKHEVPGDGLDSLEEFKERLRCHYWQQRHGNYKNTVSKAIVESGEDDEKKRKQLIDMLKQILQVTQSNTAETLTEFLDTEGTSSDIDGDCEEHIDSLGSGECVILVAGESSAGKSTVLNLLFEERILPVHANHCTATVTTVRYGPTRSARIIYNDPEIPAETVKLDEEGMQRFNELVFLQGEAREDGHRIDEVQMYLPLWFLRTGLVLADTPGIGENPFLENYLINYISKNQILGFIYVIMSDAAGGVAEDRLLLLLKTIIEQQKKRENNLPFDPKAAMFVCNRFDAVQEDDRQKVKDHILHQLGKFWPEFDATQTVFFSAQCAQRDVDANPDYVNAEYRALLDALKRLFCVSMDRRIKSTYRWIERLLRRITHFLKSTVKRLDMSEREQQDKSRTIKKKLQNLSGKTNNVVLTLRAEIKETSVQIAKEIGEYLQKPQVKFLLCSAWRDDEIPQLSENVKSIQHWYWIKERIDLAFFDRLCKLLDDWGEENCNIKAIETKVVGDIRAKLGVLEEEICEMEHDMQSDTSSISSQSDDDTGRRTSGRRRSSTLKRLSLRAFHSGSTLVEEPTSLPLQLLPRIRVKKPSDNIITRERTRRNTLIYNKNPQAWARGRAEKLLKKLLNEKGDKPKKKESGILEELVQKLLQRPLEYIDMVTEKVPSLLKANEQLLQSIELACLDEKKSMASFETMMKEIENLRTNLKNYGEGYIFVDDFKSNEVKVLQTMQSGESLKKTFTRNVQTMISNSSEGDMQSTDVCPRGLWSVVYPGFLTQGECEQEIAIRFYLPSSGVENTFADVAKLRCLTHDDLPLAEFLGIHHAELQLPAFIYRGNLQSVRRFLIHASNPRTRVPRLLQDTATALSYIHGKGLVHMELSATTVTVDEDGSVKLTGACMPRRAALPLDEEAAVSDFVYLSPEVLAGDLYIASSDVYAFGLLMFELFTQRIAFKKERTFPLQSFVKGVNPVAMLFRETDTDPALPHRMFQLLSKCVEKRDTSRPHISDVAESLKETDFDNFRKSIQTMTPANVFRKSITKERDSH